MKYIQRGQIIEDTEGPVQFIYYMTMLEDCPCQICFIQPVCNKSFLDESACDELGIFIRRKTKEIQDENQD